MAMSEPVTVASPVSVIQPPWSVGPRSGSVLPPHTLRREEVVSSPMWNQNIVSRWSE